MPRQIFVNLAIRALQKSPAFLPALGLGATKRITGVADANMVRAPVLAIAGQCATTCMHKESHQIQDRVSCGNAGPLASFLAPPRRAGEAGAGSALRRETRG